MQYLDQGTLLDRDAERLARRERHLTHCAKQEAYKLRCKERKAAIDAFAAERGWRHKVCSVGALVPGRKHDYTCRVPHEDHTEGFYEAGRGGKSVAFVSQPYQNSEKAKIEMVDWASQNGLKVEFPDIVSWHNEHCMVCIFTRDPASIIWRMVDRVGEKWVAANLTSVFAHSWKIVDPNDFGLYVERYLLSAKAHGDRTIKTTHWLMEEPRAKIFIWPIYRGLPIEHMTKDAIKAVVLIN